MSCGIDGGIDDSCVNNMGIRGFPVKCPCGRDSVIKTAKTKQNPGRPFFRCPTFRKDQYLFKWVEEAVYEEVTDALPMVESFHSDICKTRDELEGIKNTNGELMEEVKNAKMELKWLSFFMKFGFGCVCLTIIVCVVLIMLEKSNRLYVGSY